MSYEVPPGETVHECTYCGRPLADAELLALHRGLEHYDSLDEREREAYATAYETETEAVRLFRLKALGALVLLYFGLLFTYSTFT